MHICEVCGRKSKKKIRYGGYTLCSKHMHQLQKYHKFLDDNPRSASDPNEIRVYGDIAEVDVYDQRQNKVATFVIDAEDVHKVSTRRWRMSYGRIVCGNHTKTHPTTYLTHLLMNVESTDYHHKIDHIDGDPLNNRKSNLRVCTQGENVLNKARVSNNTSGIIGVHPDRRAERKAHWCAEIRRDNKRTHLGSYVLIEEAAYARHIAEIHLFGEFRNTGSDEVKAKLFERIPKKRQQEIENYVKNRLSAR